MKVHLFTNKNPELISQIEMECIPTINDYFYFKGKDRTIRKVVYKKDLVELYLSIPEEKKRISLRTTIS